MIDPRDEAPRPTGDEALHDALAFSFGDLEAGRFGLARLALDDAPRRATALAALLDANGAVAAAHASGEATEEPAWEALAVAGVRASVVEPLQCWRVSFASEAGGFELEFQAVAAPAGVVGDGDGLAAYEQPCRVTGTVSLEGHRHEVRCLGQRSREWGTLAGPRVEVRRWLGAWFDPQAALLSHAVRPAGAASDGESVGAVLFEGEPLAAVDVAVARLSTEYGPGGETRRAGLELWVGEDDDYPRRAAGQAVCRTSFDLGAARLDCAFLHWHMEGRSGAGRYEILRAA